MRLALIWILTGSIPFPVPDARWKLYAMLLTGSLFAPIFGVVGLIVAGLRQEIIETKSIPNQGVQLSIRNAIIGGLGSATVLGLILGISLETLTHELNLVHAMTVGLGTGQILALFFAPIDLASYGVWWVGRCPTLRFASHTLHSRSDSKKLRTLLRLRRWLYFSAKSGWWLSLHPPFTLGVFRKSGCT
jgi:hypothetical protein